ncbi:unnamed protein product [Didymodactylos carnosus]|uniref:Ankyrin repeat protein n=1 Tax=Didymodactylos carnosus TaxID=1234261 RepID=A0A814Q9J1_9BILA|nr:unnamed protein product [Didymodactylos carnosus]CAF1116506.1 unnamed protein product [Didymodactylos carnosus]CAF3813858.1 unnamed protein product [Didymodactylos carnosus]CAF3880334.1 unnamed protein product [Didymodactylos carnosus]
MRGLKSYLDGFKDVKNYLQLQFNMLLNKMPFTQPETVTVNEITQWITDGASTEWIDDQGQTVLCKAVDANKFDLVQALLAAGANTTFKNKDGLTPIQIAQNKTPINGQLVKTLENHAINNELKSLILSQTATVDDIRSLLLKGADINTILNANQDRPLHLLLKNKGIPEMVNAFVNEFSSDTEQMNSNGHRPIETAVLHADDNVLNEIFKLKQFTTDSFLNTKTNKSLLTFATEQKKLSAVKAIQTELNQRLWSCISFSSSSNDDVEKQPITEITTEATKLVELGAQIDHKHKQIANKDKDEYSKWTVLHLACKLGNLDLTKYLIDKLHSKAYNQAVQSSGEYPVAIAAEYGHLSIIQYLRETLGIDLNVADSINKDTPLHKAAKNNQFLVCRYLVLWGADPEAVNLAQQTPLMLADNGTKDSNKQLVQYLEQLKFDETQQQALTTAVRPRSAHRPGQDFDFCMLVVPLLVDKVQPLYDISPASNMAPNIVANAPNDILRRAATNGDLNLAQTAIVKMADVRQRDKANRSCFDQARISMKENQSQALASFKHVDRQRYESIAYGCRLVADYLQQQARFNLIKAIKESNAGRVIAYHQCGAQLTSDLLLFACSSQGDNIQIVDYLVNNSQENYEAMFKFVDGQSSPYQTAKTNKNTNIANYLQWRLSDKLATEVSRNDLIHVKQLLLAGASVDVRDKNNLSTAIKHNNLQMVQLLCENGARLTTTTSTNPDIALYLNCCIINHNLRNAAANGNFKDVIKYQRLGADINSKNCHGQTPLLLSIQYGEYYPIVHSLVSCGASMLHSAPTQSSLLILAKKRNYEQISKYLSKQLNAQILSAILDNDTAKTERLGELGADFKWQNKDDDGKTLLHYAVQYHGVELVDWLCKRNSDPMIPDQLGNYPIAIAAEKGDHAVVKYFIDNYGTTRSLRNNAGQDALAIARKKQFHAIIKLLDPNYIIPKGAHKKKVITKPKYTKDRLDRAAKYSEVQIIQEFIDQEYESKEEKAAQCENMMKIAKEEKSFEVLSMLQEYFTELTAKLTSEQIARNLITLSERQREIFYGFMASLSDLITGMNVKLDPNDPQAYKDLLTNLMTNDKQRSQTIQSMKTEQDAVKVYQQELNAMEKKISDLTLNVDKIMMDKNQLYEQIRTLETSIKDDQVSAIDKKKYFDDKGILEAQLNVLESSMLLFKQTQETAMNKKKMLDFIKNVPNLFVFYATIEHRLQSLFTGVLAAQAGFMKPELTTTKANVANTLLELAPLSLIPISEAALGPIKFVTGKLIEGIDKKQQRKELYNISALGNIGELQKTATVTAGLLTLYYSHQIESVDTKKPLVKGSNSLITTTAKIKNSWDSGPEPADEQVIVLLAQYIVDFLVKILKSPSGNDKIVKYEPLAEQLWLYVAKQDMFKQEKTTRAKDTLGLSTGKRLIPVRKSDDGTTVEVQVRQLFGCVSIITGEGTIYRFSPTKTSDSDLKLFDIRQMEVIFGYVYLDPFLADDNTVIDTIISNRKLDKLSTQHPDKVEKIDANITDGVLTLRNVSGEKLSSSDGGAISRQMALSIAKVITQEKLFVSKDEVSGIIDKHREDIKFDTNSLRQETKDSNFKFQTSINAAYEKIGRDFTQSLEKLTRENADQYEKASRKLADQIKESQTRLETVITTRMNEIEGEMESRCDKMMVIVTSAQQQAKAAVETSNKAVETGKKCAAKAKESSEQARELVLSTDKRKQEILEAMNKSLEITRETMAQQKHEYQASLNELHSKSKMEMEQIRLLAEQAKTSARESAQLARDSYKSSKKLEDIHKDEKKKLQNALKETRKICEKAVDKAEKAAIEAKKVSKKAAATD